MSREEAMQPCALKLSRELAEEAAAALREAGIDARVGAPDRRTHGLDEGTWQVSVPGTLAARARAILAASG